MKRVTIGGRRVYVDPPPMLPHAMEGALADWVRNLRGLDGFRDALAVLTSGDWQAEGGSVYRVPPPARAAIKRRAAELLDDHQHAYGTVGPTVVDQVAYQTDRETFWAAMAGDPKGAR